MAPINKIDMNNTSDSLSRRTALTALLAGGGASLAGCLGSSDQNYEPGDPNGRIQSLSQAINAPGTLKTFNVIDNFGAVGDGVHDDTAAIQSAISAAISNQGGVVYLPPGNYKITTTLIVEATQGITIQGAGRRATYITNAHRFSAIRITNTQYSVIKDLAIYQIDSIAPAIASYGIQLRSGGPNLGNWAPTVDNVLINKTWGGVLVSGCTGTLINNTILTDMQGLYGINYTGSLDSPSASCKISNLGTSQFQYTNNHTLRWINHDSYGNTLWVLWSECIGGGYGYVMDDGANLGASSRPNGGFIHFLATDHTWNDGVALFKGEIVQITNSSFVSSQQGNGLSLYAGFAGEVLIDSSRIFGNYYNGIRLDRGVNFVRITNNIISANSAIAPGQCHGIYVDANSFRFMIRGNRIGASVDASGVNNQGYGVFMAGGGHTAWFTVSDNQFEKNYIAPMFDASGASAAERTIANNLYVS